MEEVQQAETSYKSQQAELSSLRANYREDIDLLRGQLTQLTEEASRRKERVASALTRWIREFAFCSSREKLLRVARMDVTVGHIALQQIGHRVVETWNDGVVGETPGLACRG